MLIIPEDLKDLIKELAAYEDNDNEEEFAEWLYIDPPDFYEEPAIQDDEEEDWKIEIQI